MKKLFIIASTLLCLLFTASCGVTEAAAEVIDTVYNEITGQPEVWVTEPAMPSYESLEEFVDAVKNTDESEYAYERAKFEKLDEIIIPAGLPENYVLYQVQADSDLIALRYLPEDSVSDIRVSEQRGLHFYFVYHRSGSLNGIIKEEGGKKSDLVDGKYFLKETDYECTIYWEADGELLSLSLPRNTKAADGNIIHTMNSEKTVMASLDELCQTEKIVIK